MARQQVKLAVIDFETDPFKHGRPPKPFVCGFYDGNDYFSYWGVNCAERMAEFLSENKYNVYAHNGGKFDFFFLLDWLDKKIKLINGRIAKAKIGKSFLYDSYLILPLPLVAHGKDEIDYKIMEEGERDKCENKKKILSYLETDCRSLYDWVNKFIERFGKRLTLASAAFNQLKDSGYNVDIRSYQDYDDVFRPFYFGGRTEAIKKGFFPGNYNVFDINSAYPKAMLSNHPFGTNYYVVENPDSLPDTDVYFARILAISRGAFPVRRKDHSVEFPKDDELREYNVTGWEIEAALRTGTAEIKKVLSVLIHDETANFKTYVKKFYAEKLKAELSGDRDSKTFSKLMLNSAYGKFGQNGLEFREYAITDKGDIPLSEDDYKKAQSFMREYNADLDDYLDILAWEYENDMEFGKSLWSRPDPDERFYNVAVAASITGYVRAFLWESICKAVDPIYCDTDSIICKSFSGDMGNEIGKWKLEGETYEGVYIGGKKLYTMHIGKTEFKSESSLLTYKGKKYRSVRMIKKYKKAHKGAKLTHEEIVDIVLNGKTVEWFNPAPSFNLKMGTRFIHRQIRGT